MDLSELGPWLAGMVISGFFWRVLQGERRWGKGKLRALRAGIDAQFRAFEYQGSDPLYHFMGSTATVVKDFEEIVQTDDGFIFTLRVQRYARNAAGEYFLFIGDGIEKPFFKHVEHRMARIVLEDAYVEPPVR